MSKKSSKLEQMSQVFKKLNINFEKLGNKGINDMIEIIKSKMM